MGEAPKTRPWYRLHWLTWVLVLLVGGSLVLVNIMDLTFHHVETWGYNPEPNPYLAVWRPHDFGWPFVYTFPNESIPLLEDYYIGINANDDNWVWLRNYSEFLDYSLPFMLINILIALTILASTAFATESYLRRQAKWQYTIKSIILLTVFVALLLTNAKYDLVRWRGDSGWEFIPFIFIAVGLWCVFWTGCRLIGWGVGRMSGGSGDG